MRVEYTREEIRSALEAWTELVTPMHMDGVIRVDRDLIITYLNQGFCFRFTNENFKKWKEREPEYIHAYPAIFEGKLKFVVIDSTSDMNPQSTTDYISVFDFDYGELDDALLITEVNFVEEPSMPLAEALRRNFIWKMHCRSWLNSILKDKEVEIFKAISIPFIDLCDLFQPIVSEIELSDIDQSAIAFFGLKKSETAGEFDIEFILTNEQTNYNLPATLYDISRPVPPFGGQQFDFKLLPVVDYSNEL